MDFSHLPGPGGDIDLAVDVRGLAYQAPREEVVALGAHPFRRTSATDPTRDLSRVLTILAWRVFKRRARRRASRRGTLGAPGRGRGAGFRGIEQNPQVVKADFLNQVRENLEVGLGLAGKTCHDGGAERRPGEGFSYA